MWIGIAVIAAVIYGIVNDQITATVSPEYYSVFKRDQFEPIMGLMFAPTRVVALVTGTMGTWWYGLFLGIMLGICSMVGRCAPLPTRRYIQAVGWVMTTTMGVSVLFGVVAYIAEPFIKPDVVHWPFLAGIEDVRSAFAVGWWHNGAYLGAFAASIVAGYRVQRERMRDKGHS
jgi:hypothetical protein